MGSVGNLAFFRLALRFFTFWIWEFPKTRGSLSRGTYNKDPTVWGPMLVSPIGGPPYEP